MATSERKNLNISKDIQVVTQAATAAAHKRNKISSELLPRTCLRKPRYRILSHQHTQHTLQTLDYAKRFKYE